MCKCPTNCKCASTSSLLNVILQNIKAIKNPAEAESIVTEALSLSANNSSDDKKKDSVEEKETKPKERGPFSYINTETTSMHTRASSSISESFAKEIGLSNKN